jgi:hypothetical protein
MLRTINYDKDTKTLYISFLFNEKISYIPAETENIIFLRERHNESFYNQKIYNFPKNLTHLTFGWSFNQKVNNLPKNLTHLTFGLFFKKKVNNLPKNLTHLIFGEKFNQKLNNMPKNLKLLGLGWNFQNEIIFPKNLKKLLLTCNNILINNIPEQIEKIYIDFSYCNIQNKKVENLPYTIKEIVIQDKKHKKYIKVPFGCVLSIKK